MYGVTSVLLEDAYSVMRLVRVDTSSCGSCCCGSWGYAVVESLRDVWCYATGKLLGDAHGVMQLVGH